MGDNCQHTLCHLDTPGRCSVGERFARMDALVARRRAEREAMSPTHSCANGVSCAIYQAQLTDITRRQRTAGLS